MKNKNTNETSYVAGAISPEVKAAFIAEHTRKTNIARSLTEEERFHIFSMGYYNNAVRGYLIEALNNAGFKKKEINRALEGLSEALSEHSPKEAEEIYIRS